MDALKIQAKVYRGLGIGAKHLGTPFSIYRAVGPNAPLSPDNLSGTLLCAFSAEASYAFVAPPLYAKPLRFGVFDGSQTLPGDYLVGDTGTYFIASQEILAPILLVTCNRTISFTKAAAPVLLGLNPPGGETESTDVDMQAGWPASVLQGTKGENSATKLPGETRVAWWTILVPAWPGILFHMGDQLSDEIGRRYIVSSAELSMLGWRMTAAQAET